MVMNSELFQPTLPLGEPELMRASAYQRYLDEMRTASGGISTRISQLSPSLKADLLRFGDDGGASEMVEVMAAYRPAPMCVSVLYPTRRQRSRRLGAFIAWFAALMVLITSRYSCHAVLRASRRRTLRAAPSSLVAALSEWPCGLDLALAVFFAFALASC